MRYSSMPSSQRAHHRHTHDNSGSTSALPVKLGCRECGEILIHDWKCSIAKTIKGTAWLRDEDRVNACSLTEALADSPQGIIERAGMEYLGEQLGAQQNIYGWMFNDPQTNSTLMIRGEFTVGDVLDKVEKNRALHTVPLLSATKAKETF